MNVPGFLRHRAPPGARGYEVCVVNDNDTLIPQPSLAQAFALCERDPARYVRVERRLPRQVVPTTITPAMRSDEELRERRYQRAKGAS